MAELMTVESIIEAYYQMRGYMTKVRVPIKVKNNYSDIDVLAYHPRTRTLTLCESKAHGKKTSARAIQINVVDDLDKPQEEDLLRFIENVVRAIHQHEALPEDLQKVKCLKVHFVNVHQFGISTEVEIYLIDKLNQALQSNNIKKIKIEIVLETHFDLLMKMIKDTREDQQGRRYGHPILDIIRELNRHTFTSNTALRERNKTRLRDAFNL